MPPFNFGPDQIKRWTWAELLMVLGQHRPKGWWPEPEKPGRKKRKGRGLPSGRDQRERDKVAMRAAGRARNEARRAAAAAADPDG